MSLIKRNFFIFCLFVIFFLSLFTDWYEGLSIFFFCMTTLTILNKLGKGIVLRELIVLHAVFVCLLMPVVGYEVYNQQNRLARIFVKYMLVPQEQYFGFVLPAISAFAVAICWPITDRNYIIDEGASFQHLLSEIKNKLKTNRRAGNFLIIIGMIMFFVTNYLPVELRFFASLFYSGSFAGALYIYYSPDSRANKILLIVFILFIAWTSIQSGVFTIVAYMGITLFSFLFIGKKFSLGKKLAVCLVSIVFLFLIQNIKAGYRHVTWRGTFTGNKTDVFSDIAYDKLTHLEALIDVKALFPIYTRANQGFNITLVMRRIPAVQDYDGGRRLATITISALVPRFLWPDKPEAGGKEAMLYFTGLHISGWSTNISPIGEAYGSFGPQAGIFFMFLLGVFIRWVYKKVFIISRKIPLIVLWIPVLFFQVTYSMETDTLQILNSLFKSSFFVWLLYKTIPAWFGIVKLDPRMINLAKRRQNISA